MARSDQRIPPKGGSGTAPPRLALSVFEACRDCKYWHPHPTAAAYGWCKGDLPRFQIDVGPGGPVLGYGLTRSDLPKCRHGEMRA